MSSGSSSCWWARKFEEVQHVHMVYMTHLDITFSDYRRDVCDFYSNGTGACHAFPTSLGTCPNPGTDNYNTPHDCYCPGLHGPAAGGHFVEAMATAQELRRRNASEDAPRFVCVFLSMLCVGVVSIST